MKTICTLMAIIIMAGTTANSQTVIGRQNVDQYPINSAGTLTYGLTWLPQSYSTSTRTYPLIIFLHGAGETGTTVSSLTSLTTSNPRGIPGRIADGWNATAVNPLTGVRDSFIVVSPQAPSWSYNYNHVRFILPNIISRYRVDTTRIYLTGLSAGGGGTLSVLGSMDSTLIKKIAAVATFSSAGVDAVNGYTDLQVESNLKYATKNWGVQAWTVAGDQDYLLNTDVRYHDTLNKLNPPISNKLTVISGVGHNAWGKGYDTSFRPMLNYYGSTANCQSGCLAITAPNNNGSPVRGSGKTQDSLNTFEWFLLYKRTFTAVTTPTANAGSNQTVTLPTTTAPLNGSGTPAPGNTISNYQWTKESGPAATIQNPSSATTTVNGLVQGVYTFKLTVTQSGGLTASSTTNVVVNSSGTYASPAVTVSANQTVSSANANVTSSNTITGAALSSVTWSKFSVPGQSKKKIGILGSSTSAGSGATNYDSSYAGRVLNYYKSAGLVDSVVNLAYSGYNIYQAMPTGYVPPQAVTNKLYPSDRPDTMRNITAMLKRNPDVVILCFPTNGFDVLTIPEIMTPFQTIYDLCRSRGVECYVTTSQPRTDASFDQNDQNFLQVVRDSILNRFGSRAINFYDAIAVPGTTQQMSEYSYGDNIHLNNAGHKQLFNLVVGTNILSNLIGSTSVIAAPNAGNTAITALPNGPSKFQVTVKDSHGQMASAVTTITASTSTACNGVKRIIVPYPTDSSVYLTPTTSLSTNTFYPGDTLVLNSAYSSVDIKGLNGSPGCPIVIINQGVQAKITKRLNLDGCKFVKVTGSGTSNPYGILIEQHPYLRQQYYHAIQISNRSKNIEIERVFMHNVDIGIVCETNESCADSLNYPNWVLDSMSFHDNKIVGTWNEGMYIGHTSPDNASYDMRPVVCNGVTTYPAPMKNGYTRIYNNIVDSTGRGGIQLANAAYGISEVYGNTVKHNGLNGDDAQGTAISVGLYTRAYIHDNIISNTLTWGIASIGGGATNIPLRIENNVIDSSGYLTHYDLATTSKTVYNPNTEPTFVNSLPWPQAIEVDSRPRYYVNGTPNAGTAIPGQDSTVVYIKNNTIGRKKNNVAINIEDHYLGLQKNAHQICGNVNAGTGTAAVISMWSGITYTVCSGTAVANAGAAQTITLPTSQVTLDGSASTGATTYTWTKISGPSSFAITSPNAAVTTVTGLVQGVYVFQLAVNGGSTSTVQITVNSAPAPPVANAGPDQIINLPTNIVTLSASASTGVITSYTWTKISGPSSFNITSPNTVSTTVTGLVKGVYVFRVALNGGSTSTVRVTVNYVPIAHAGPDQSIILPINIVYLLGSGTDAEGNMLMYAWKKVSGPSQYSIVHPNKPKTAITNLAKGTYVFELKVTDNLNASGRDSVTITVNGGKIIKVKVFGGTNAYNNAEWNNWNVVSSSTSQALKYSDGTNSAVTAVLSASQDLVDNSDSYGGGMAPAEVLRHTSYSQTARTLTIRGLEPSKVYDLELFGSRAMNPNNFTSYKVGTKGDTVATYNNFNDKGMITGLTANAQGNLVVNIGALNSYNYINGFTITEASVAPGTATTAGDLTVPVNAVQAKPLDKGTLSIYPNPVQHEFTLDINNEYTGMIRVSIIDQAGVIKQNIEFNKGEQLNRAQIPVNKLPAGVYFVRIQMGANAEVRKMVKL